jgi:hypothetical protein
MSIRKSGFGAVIIPAITEELAPKLVAMGLIILLALNGSHRVMSRVERFGSPLTGKWVERHSGVSHRDPSGAGAALEPARVRGDNPRRLEVISVRA